MSEPLFVENNPGTFSYTKNFGYSIFVAFCISLAILILSKNKPLLSSFNPPRLPATLFPWHGAPLQIMSTGVSSAPSNFVISPNCCTSGKWYFDTAIGKSSISLLHIGLIPFSLAAKSHPPTLRQKGNLVLILVPYSTKPPSFLITLFY